MIGGEGRVPPGVTFEVAPRGVDRIVPWAMPELDGLVDLVGMEASATAGASSQTMAEVAIRAEKGGVSRADFFAFLNDSVMGSMFTRYKTPAYVNLDFTPTFTPLLLRKDFDLGMQAARELDVPMPVAAAAQQAIQALIGSGHTDEDFAALLAQQALASGLDLVSEEADVDEGLVIR